jgi:hypothetical protein
MADLNVVEELGLHGVLLLCRELGLIDNITEHADVMKSFAVILHRKIGRLGPAGSHTLPKAEVWSSSATAATAGSCIRTQPCVDHAPEQQQGSSDDVRVAGPVAVATCSSSTSSLAVDLPEAPDPATLRVVYVIRPGVPAADADVKCVSENASAVAAALSVGRTRSPGPISRGGSPDPKAETPASIGLHIHTLDVLEILELLLLVGFCQVLCRCNV